jgi:hypothetical protein
MSSNYIKADFTSDYFRELLQNLDLKLILDSPKDEYRFEYYTVATKEVGTSVETKTRKYRLLDQVRGTITVEPWNAFSLERHAEILSGLIRWSHYRLKVSVGWQIQCPSCDQVVTGKPWQLPSKSCTSKHLVRCLQKFDDTLVSEVYTSSPESVANSDRAAA